MSNNRKPIVHLRVFKGREMLYDADGNVRTPSQIVKLTHDTVEWKNFLNNLPATFGMAKVEKVLSDLGNGEYKEVENPVEITKEVEAVFKTPEKELTPEQKRIAELEEAVKALSKGNKSTKGIDLLEELKKEWASLTDAKPGEDWTVQDFQDAISDIKNTK
jgi:hypothetical protein